MHYNHRAQFSVATPRLQQPWDEVTGQSASGCDFRCINLANSLIDLGLGQFMALQFSGEVGFVGRHVEMAVATEIEEDRAGDTFFFGTVRLTNGRMAGVS